MNIAQFAVRVAEVRQFDRTFVGERLDAVIYPAQTDPEPFRKLALRKPGLRFDKVEQLEIEMPPRRLPYLICSILSAAPRLPQYG